MFAIDGSEVVMISCCPDHTRDEMPHEILHKATPQNPRIS
jgi:hypothetical protein